MPVRGVVLLRAVGALIAVAGLNVARAPAQQREVSPADPHTHHEASPREEHAGHDMAWKAREGSGTAWVPDASPMYAVHAETGGWQLMAHQNLFAQFLRESGSRGAEQFGSINWVMGMASRPVGAGRFGLRGMISLEPWTVGGCGYPDLLASGERCNGEPIHDRQHQHDVAMELAVSYDAPLFGAARWQVYGGPAAEPALGPVAYPHRPSATANLLAPIAHHWLDATHISFGTVTAGVYGARWKVEASAFNGREPDERRTDVDFGRMDSLSGRVWVMPSPDLVLQVSVGKLTEGELVGEDGGGARAVDVTRATASAMHHRVLGPTSFWATTVAWGRNSESEEASSAWLLESTLMRNDRHAWFGRIEVAGKSAHALALEDESGTFRVGKLQGGYTRYFQPRSPLDAWAPGVGFSLSTSIVPRSLRAVYGGRVNIGAAAYMTLRPGRATK